MQENNMQRILQEDEIDLRELFATIKKHLFKIFIFVSFVGLATLVYLIFTPNVYKSSITLTSQTNGGKSLSGSVGQLAALAGVNLSNSSGELDPFVLMKATLNDYAFNAKIITKYKLDELLNQNKNQVYPFGFEFESSQKQNNELSKEEKIYHAYLDLKSMISIEQDKTTNLISLSATNTDRFLAKKLVDLYLKNIIEEIKLSDLKDLNKQITFYKRELESVTDVALKQELSKSLSVLLQKKVFSQANEYYFVNILTHSQEAYIKDKIKPQRALILVVSVVVSLIVGIFLAFFIEFLRPDEKNA